MAASSVNCEVATTRYPVPLEIASTGNRNKPSIAGIAFLLVLVTLFFAAWLSFDTQRRPNNNRSALIALTTLRSAQWDFRENDRDGNGVQDYWTGDIAGLYRFGLIERGVAEADAHPLVPLVPTPIPFNGYFFKVLIQDDTSSPPEIYAQETDVKSGKVHHRSKYALCIYPADPGVTGDYMYVTHESYSGYSCPAKGRAVPTNLTSDIDREWNRCLGGVRRNPDGYFSSTTILRMTLPADTGSGPGRMWTFPNHPVSHRP